jgi:hypothetical protein
LIDNGSDPEEHVKKESNDKLKIRKIDTDDRYGERDPDRHEKLNQE